jgi:hypothetical protein
LSLSKNLEWLWQIINSNVGDENDFIKVPYSFGDADNTVLAYLTTGYYHVHGQSFVYPNHADNVVLTAGAGAWDLSGSITEIIPADTLTVSTFDLHWLNISDISENAEIQIDIYSGGAGSEVLVGSARAARNAVQSQEGAHRIQIPQQSSGNRISCRLSSSVAGATTCSVSFEGHYYA